MCGIWANCVVVAIFRNRQKTFNLNYLFRSSGGGKHDLDVYDSYMYLFRSPSGVELDLDGYGASVTHRPAGHLCHPHLRNHWTGAVFWNSSQDLLR